MAPCNEEYAHLERTAQMVSYVPEKKASSVSKRGVIQQEEKKSDKAEINVLSTY
jgi:hypothetical protein